MKGGLFFVLILIIIQSLFSQMIGGYKTLPPIMIEKKVKTANISVGKLLIFNIGKDEIGKKDEDTTILTCVDNCSDNNIDKCSDIVEIFQAKDDGMAQYNPGLKAIKVGTAKINVQLKSGCNYDVVVNVI